MLYNNGFLGWSFNLIMYDVLWREKDVCELDIVQDNGAER